MKKNTKVRQITLLGLFTAATLALSYFEAVLTSFLPLPPGVKPGLANVAITFICLSLGFLPALTVTLLKAGFMFFVNGFSGALISGAGGIFSIVCTALLLKLKQKYGKKLSFTGVSVVASVFHNIGQLTAASALIGSSLYLAYLPVLLVSAVIFGLLTGTLMNAVMPFLIKLDLFHRNNP